MSKNKKLKQEAPKLKFAGKCYRPFFNDMTKNTEQLKSFESLHIEVNGDVYIFDNLNKVSWWWGNLYKIIEPIPVKHHEINVNLHPGFSDFGDREKLKSSTPDNILYIAYGILGEDFISDVEIFNIWTSRNGVKYHSFKYGDYLIIVDKNNHYNIEKIIFENKEYEIPNLISNKKVITGIDSDLFTEDEIKLSHGYKQYLKENQENIALGIFDRQQIKNKVLPSKIPGLKYDRN
jgi:hypothetical protein